MYDIRSDFEGQTVTVELASLADMLMQGLDEHLDKPAGPTRWPLLRSGDRDRIAARARWLIHERDGYACQRCGLTLSLSERPARRTVLGIRLELDHITPWSAWGSDRSDNLQTLCDPCNDDRSNWREPILRHTIGVTAACYWCAQDSGILPALYLELRPDELDRTPAYCGRCGTTSWVPDPEWLL